MSYFLQFERPEFAHTTMAMNFHEKRQRVPHMIGFACRRSILVTVVSVSVLQKKKSEIIHSEGYPRRILANQPIGNQLVIKSAGFRRAVMPQIMILAINADASLSGGRSSL